MKKVTLLALLALTACTRVTTLPGTPDQQKPRALSNEEWLRLAQQQPTVIGKFGNLTAVDALRHSLSSHRAVTNGKATEFNCEGHLLALSGEKINGYAGFIKVVPIDGPQTTAWAVTEDRQQATVAIERALAEHCKA